MSFARWQPYYTDRELELDRRIHALGLLLALIATPLLLGLAAESRQPGLVLPCAIYLLSLLGMLGSSALYRHTPLRWSNYRWFLRRPVIGDAGACSAERHQSRRLSEGLLKKLLLAPISIRRSFSDRR